MTGPALSERRRLHWHAPEKGTTPAFVLSLLAHAVLFLAIAFDLIGDLAHAIAIGARRFECGRLLIQQRLLLRSSTPSRNPRLILPVNAILYSQGILSIEIVGSATT